jgi:hypothetical protein
MESLVLLETVRSAHCIKKDLIAVWTVNVPEDLKLWNIFGAEHFYKR